MLLSRGEYHSNITQQKPLKEFLKELKNNSKHKSRRAISRKTRKEKILELKKLLILIKNLFRRTFGQPPEFSSFRKSSIQSIGTSPEHQIQIRGQNFAPIAVIYWSPAQNSSDSKTARELQAQSTKSVYLTNQYPLKKVGRDSLSHIFARKFQHFACL